VTTLRLSLFDLPPAVPTFGPNYVEELAIANNGDVITLKLRVPSLPAQYTVVQGASPRSAGVSCFRHFPNLSFLPAPVDGRSDITALYVAWYGIISYVWGAIYQEYARLLRGALCPARSWLQERSSQTPMR